MRSWSNRVSLSSSRKSDSSVGPCAPARSELWLSLTTRPCPVVRTGSAGWVYPSICFCLAAAASPGLVLRCESVLDWGMKAPVPRLVAARFLLSGVQVERRFDRVDDERERKRTGCRCGAPDQPFRNRGDHVHGNP